MNRDFSKSFLRDDPRNKFEVRENDLIKQVFAIAAGNLQIDMAIGNLIMHYRKEITRYDDLSRDVIKSMKKD